jgi:hypothetical protein
MVANRLDSMGLVLGRIWEGGFDNDQGCQPYACDCLLELASHPKVASPVNFAAHPPNLAPPELRLATTSTNRLAPFPSTWF